MCPTTDSLGLLLASIWDLLRGPFPSDYGGSELLIGPGLVLEVLKLLLDVRVTCRPLAQLLGVLQS